MNVSHKKQKTKKELYWEEETLKNLLMETEYQEGFKKEVFQNFKDLKILIQKKIRREQDLIKKIESKKRRGRPRKYFD